MDLLARIERSLDQAVSYAQGAGAPPLLSSALRYSVFPGGHRIRPQLCLSVAKACGDSDPDAADAAATAIELLHCASLVHDDLPCFDDAAIRRGKASVHCAFGAPIAVLSGDALIVLAFETLAHRAAAHPSRLTALLTTIGRSVGSPERHRSGPSVGVGSRRFPHRLSTGQDGRIICCGDRRRRRRSRRRSRSLGRSWAQGSARPTRSRTICATSFAMPRNSVSRSGRMQRARVQTLRRNWGSAARSIVWKRSSRRRSIPFPPVPAPRSCAR